MSGIPILRLLHFVRELVETTSRLRHFQSEEDHFGLLILLSLKGNASDQLRVRGRTTGQNDLIGSLPGSSRPVVTQVPSGDPDESLSVCGFRSTSILPPSEWGRGRSGLGPLPL